MGSWMLDFVYIYCWLLADGRLIDDTLLLVIYTAIYTA